jgi:hypothetical protein
MPLKLWVREADKGLLAESCDIELSTYVNDILTGRLDNEGLLAKIGKSFVLGKEGIWTSKAENPKSKKQEISFAKIKNSSAYPNGLILSPYSAVDVKYHLGSKTIDQTTPLEKIQLMGSDQEDFAVRVFRTYYHTVGVKRFCEKDNHLVLYSTHV